MAGMLPGVESARRRRFHNSNLNYSTELSPTTSGRRSSFCRYTSSHDFHSNSSTRSQISSQQGLRDESRLSAAAREAKKRLDERLQPRWRSETKRNPSGQQKSSYSDSKRLNWLKLSWKSTEQDECAVCLEDYKAGHGGTLMQLQCGHRFHTKCLMPWLEGNAHCPCCRMEISS